VEGYLDAAQLPEIEGEIIAVMAPHAGYIYSGPVAGYAFAALRGLVPDLVVVVSPMHHPYREDLLTSAHQAYNTPLGSIPIERDMIARLDACLQAELGTSLRAIRKDPEHSLEIELPFLQQVFAAPFSLIPVMMREQTEPVARGLGSCLARVLKGRSVILVASTDLSHFYPQETANRLDKQVLSKVEAFDPEGVLQVERQGIGFACGRGALAAVMWAAKKLGADTARVLNYATSGDVTGDLSQVVGYAAAVMTRSKSVVR
jgi:AmmeMemoRadiSam system protein B